MGRFNIEDFSGVHNKNLPMICDNRREAEIFCAYLDSVGMRWCIGDSYTSRTNYQREDGTAIAYFFNKGTYSASLCRDDALKNGRYLRFKDFDWSEDNNADVVETGGWDDIVAMIGG